MVGWTFRSVKAGMAEVMRGERGGNLRDDRAGEAVVTRRAERITTMGGGANRKVSPRREVRMGDAACSGGVTLYGGAV
ncbi:hypothetical protein BZB76_6060 [Actinomadura pelletieri DSM 43383]|uniref:Uncharacterized protein n=1 Tax=Actinomadura pelletieri DSM 43383 TaxID=1120940 RepID=A0A495QB50_9ACTN|nr:hypothetical protein BZB76_6060 [Actinomadura pelletieri DSM 43383]